ncbi:hypothetical protein QQP08_002374 [Theobroma cacao]|nr:hypothetical protein QQP08_002374 [Theobroma cacao]
MQKIHQKLLVKEKAPTNKARPSLTMSMQSQRYCKRHHSPRSVGGPVVKLHEKLTSTLSKPLKSVITFTSDERKGTEQGSETIGERRIQGSLYRKWSMM